MNKNITIDERKKLGGRIFGRNLSEIKFVYDSIQEDGSITEIDLGQILVIDDAVSKAKFFVRVVDIEYGQSDLWAKEMARDLNETQSRDFSNEHETPTNIYQADMRRQMYLVAVAEPLGTIGLDGRFVSVKRLPAYFSPVYKVNEDDFGEDVRSQLGDLNIGKLRSGSDILDIDVGIFSELLPYHIGVFAKTGGGKSNTMKVLLGSIMDSIGKAGALIFEPHGEYIQDLRRHPLAKDQLVCFTQNTSKGGLERKIRITYEDISVGALMNVRDSLMWTDAQERFLREASYAHNDWLYQILNLPMNDAEMEIMGDYRGSLLNLFPDYKEDTLKAIRSKLRQVVSAPYVSQDQDASVSNIDEIMILLEQGKTVLIDMASLSGLHELLLSTILANKVLERRRKAYADDRENLLNVSPSISIVMEEAQRVLGSGVSPSSVFAQIVNEGRKFKVGLIAITQQPKLMNEVLMSQFTSLIILGITDSKDFEILKSVSQKPLDRLREEIKSLMPGQSILTSPKYPFAVPVQIFFYDTYIKMVKERMSKVKKATSSSSSYGGFF